MSALIWCPFPDLENAHTIGEILLRENLIACANILQPCESLFIWEGKLERAAEVPVLMKTNENKMRAAIARLEELHPYDAPAVMGWRADQTGDACAAWLQKITPDNSQI